MKKINSEELDGAFDDGEDMSEHFDFKNPRKINYSQKRINIDLPIWIVDALDHESKKIGVTRQSIVKFWLSEKLKSTKNEKGS